jgi:hypothetical protein
MYGASMGTLSVEALKDGKWVQVWSKTGRQHNAQADEWTSAQVTLPDCTQLRFKGTRGSSYLGDMCIDTVAYSSVPFPTPPSTCSFESTTMCGWTQSGAKQWARGDRTPSLSTGASQASKGKYFIFLETNYGSAGTVSYFTSPTFTGMKYISFKYHMYGAAMGTLAVEAKLGSTWTSVWALTGQQNPSASDPWKVGHAHVPDASTQVRFKGVRGAGTTGDICVDSVALSSVAPPPPPPMQCTFESSTCGWTETGGKYWTRGTRTPSSGTGPSKAQGSIYFMYLESNYGATGTVSYLVSPSFHGMKYLRWYHLTIKQNIELPV